MTGHIEVIVFVVVVVGVVVVVRARCWNVVENVVVVVVAVALDVRRSSLSWMS